MKKLLLIFCILGMREMALAQWTSASGYSYTTDKVGIGTTAPSEKFEVKGRIQAGDRIYAQSSSIDTISLVQSYNSAAGPAILRSYSGTSYWDFAASQSQGGSSLFIGRGIDISLNNAAFTINSNNNVGIGTTSPTERLSVNGKIRAKEIKVETSGWADFVFDRDYKLLSLKATESFIAANGHLPEIPSAKDVEKNGINLGEINSKLLQKIEELTLHLIEKDKQVTNLLERMKVLEEKR